MSGGMFDYNQRKIKDIQEELEFILDTWNDEDDFGDRYSSYIKNEKEIRKDIVKTIKLLKESYVRVQRLDWLFSGDDSEESYFNRLKKDLEN